MYRTPITDTIVRPLTTASKTDADPARVCPGRVIDGLFRAAAVAILMGTCVVAAFVVATALQV